MEGEWSELPLEEAMDAIIDYRGKTPKKTDSGIPLITAKIVKNGRIQPTQEYIAEADYDSWMQRGIPQKGDVVLTTEAPLGEVAQLDGSKIALAQRIITLRGKSGLLDSDFLKFLLQSHAVQHQFDGRASGTTVSGIKQSELRQVLLSFPPLHEQKAIAHVLGSLDDKIELNRRMNETLEGMAQALFKSWFVDFDPVIDNALAAGNPIPEPLAQRAETRRQAIANRTANRDSAQAFPASFRFTEELGYIPEGWEVKEIRERTKTIQYGLTQSASEEECGPRFLRITDIRGGEIKWNQVPYCETSPDQFEKYKINDGDIFVARTGASTGENVYVSSPEQSVFASYLVRLTFENRGIGRIVGMFMRTPRYFEYIDAILGGSAQPNASAQTLASASMVFPSNDCSELFFEKASLMDSRKVTNEKESQTLANLRDVLLPKLISGELRIPQAEKMVEEAVA